MRILVHDGTALLGRHYVDAALLEVHHVTRGAGATARASGSSEALPHT